MKKLTKEILERDVKRDIGAEILEAIGEIKAGGGRRFVGEENLELADIVRARASERRIKVQLDKL